MAAIDISAINTTKAQIHTDLIVSMSGVTNADLLDLGVNIIRGVENEDKIVVYKGYRQIATRYNVNSTSRSKLGKAYERVLKVTNDIVYVPDNVQNYRTKEYFSMLGTSSNGQEAATDIIEKRLRLQAMQFGSHVVDNFFFGDESKGLDDYFGLYNGLLTKIKADKDAGLVAAAEGNYINLGSLTLTDAEGCYDAYVAFFEKLDPTLAKNCVVWTTKALYNAVVRGYINKFPGAQAPIIQALNPKGGFVSHETEGAVLKKSALLGTGYGFIATVPGNVDYATDLTGSEEPSDAYIDIIKDPSDHLNSVLIGMQCASGTRLRDFNKEAFAISNDTFTAPTITNMNNVKKVEVINEDIIAQLAERIKALEKA